jgi:hypothetical protein
VNLIVARNVGYFCMLVNAELVQKIQLFQQVCQRMEKNDKAIPIASTREFMLNVLLMT